MIEKKTVSQIVEEWLEGKDYFLVEVTVSPDDKIVVEIDHAEGVWIEDCVELSRFIESKLNREEEDYELEVGSAGIGQPFKVLQHFKRLPDSSRTYFQFIIFLFTVQLRFDKAAQLHAIFNPNTLCMVYLDHNLVVRAYGHFHQKVVFSLQPLFNNLTNSFLFYH